MPTAAPAGDRAAVTGPWAIALLGWIGATKATGAALATIALVDASRALALTPDERTLAASVGTLALAATVIASGLLADRIGRRRVLMGSFAIAILGSMLLAVSWGVVPYVLGAVVTGVAYGAMFAGSFAYVKTVAPGSGLGWALGLFGTYATIVAALASISGGYLADVSWRALFLVVPVMCVISLLATPRLLPVVPRVPGGRVDITGLVLLGLGLVLLLAGVSRATTAGGWGSWGPAGVGVAVLALWCWWEARQPDPAFPIRLFRSGPFAAAALVGVTFNIVQAASSLQFSDYWQFVDGQTPFVVSLEIQPFYVLGIVGALVAGRLLSAGRSPRALISISCLITGAGLLAVVPLSQSASYWAYLPAIAVIGTGMMAGMTAQSQVFVDQAPHTSYGSVTASRSTVGQIGFAFGFAASTAIIQRLTDAGTLTRLQESGVSPSRDQRALGAVEGFVESGRVAAGGVVDTALADAAASFHSALQILMLLCAVVMLVSAGAVWLLMRDRPRPH